MPRSGGQAGLWGRLLAVSWVRDGGRTQLEVGIAHCVTGHPRVDAADWLASEQWVWIWCGESCATHPTSGVEQHGIEKQCWTRNRSIFGSLPVCLSPGTIRLQTQGRVEGTHRGGTKDPHQASGL